MQSLFWDITVVSKKISLAQPVSFKYYEVFSWGGGDLQEKLEKTLVERRKEVHKTSIPSSARHQKRHQRNEEGRAGGSLNQIYKVYT